ncbi:MAG: outer membrane lipoprotein chaperone LolA [Pseudomonadota bacterium]
MKNQAIARCLFAVTALCTAFFYADVQAQSDADELTARGEARLEAFVTEVTTLNGAFTQTVYGADGSLDDEYTGQFAVQRPGRFRWSYESPYEQLLVADGKRLWNYDVDLEQISVTDQSEALGQSPARILSGTADALESLDIQGAFESDDVLWVQMQVLDDESDFAALRFGFDAADGRLAGMQVTDNLGQLTVIEFRDVEENQPVDDSLFRFEPPENADVVGLDDEAEIMPQPQSPLTDKPDSEPIAGLG